MSGYVVSPRARADMDEIWTYIAQGNRSAATRMIRRMTDKFAVLARQPGIGELRGDLCPGLRCVPLESYVIYYEIEASRVRIVRVLHGARDIGQFYGSPDESS
jgi:toxin ParE1/3/4